MNETRSTHRRGRVRARLAVVLCLALVIGSLPLAAFAMPATVTDAQATYVNSAMIALTPGCSYSLDGGQTLNAATTVTTSVYGAHVLALDTLWKDAATGTTQTVMTIPFFVDEDVAPVVKCDSVSSYVSAASIKLAATDNFNGSGIDSLYYRIDGGSFVQVVAPASVTATKLFIARLAQVTAAKLVAVDPSLPVPSGHAAGPKTPEQCVLCHDILGPTPTPDPTPEPTSTPTPAGGLSKTVTVTGPGVRTIEYWAQDIARNASVHVTKTFTITSASAPMSVWRFYRPSTGTHFYTADAVEMARIRDTMGSIYRLEGVTYSINTANAANSVPLYRFYRASTGTHLYTADATAMARIRDTRGSIYHLEGVAYNVSSTTGTPVVRFFSPSKGVHFYSADPAEIASVRANLTNIWSYEGVSYYIGQ